MAKNTLRAGRTVLKMNLLENENNTKEDDAAVYISFLSKSYQLLEDLINKLVCLVQFIRNLTTSMNSLML